MNIPFTKSVHTPTMEELRQSFINIKINLENDVIRLENEYYLARENLDKMKLLNLLKELFETKNHYIKLIEDIFLLPASREDEILFKNLNDLIQRLTALIDGIKLMLPFVNHTDTNIQRSFLPFTPNNTHGGKKRRRKTNKKVNNKKSKSKTKDKRRRRKGRTLKR